MKSVEEITEIVKRHGGKHLQFGNVPSWVNKGMQEGIELKAGIIKSFWIKDAARVYDEPISDSWGKCLVEILETPKKEEEKKTEQLPATAGAKPAVKKCLCGAVIAENYIRCKSCDEKLKARAGEDKQLLILEHINWNLGLISQYFAWQMQQVQNSKNLK